MNAFHRALADRALPRRLRRKFLRVWIRWRQLWLWFCHASPLLRGSASHVYAWACSCFCSTLSARNAGGRWSAKHFRISRRSVGGRCRAANVQPRHRSALPVAAKSTESGVVESKGYRALPPGATAGPGFKSRRPGQRQRINRLRS